MCVGWGCRLRSGCVRVGWGGRGECLRLVLGGLWGRLGCPSVQGLWGRLGCPSVQGLFCRLWCPSVQGLWGKLWFSAQGCGLLLVRLREWYSLRGNRRRWV